MNTANFRAASLLDRRRLEALLHGCVRAFACAVLLVFLAVTLWLPTISANAGGGGVASVDEAGRVECSNKVPSQAGLVQGAVGVCSVNNHNYCIAPEAEFGEWCRLVQWTASSPLNSRTGAICLDRSSYRGEEMPGIPGILSLAKRPGGSLSARQNDDATCLESVCSGFRISPDYRGELSVLNHGYGLTFGLQI